MIQKRGFYMNVKIGKHIKELRNRDGVTQDALAEALGVTGQAISKWENESGYPDIEYITPIANFFNVTIDQLFGHDRSESENKINEYCEKLDELHRNWADVNTRIDLARQALAEFPAEEKLLVRLATALWEKWSDDASDECFLFVDGKTVYNFDKVRATEGWEEPAQIMEKLLATSIDDKIRSECRDILIRLYGNIGEKEKVYKLAEYCPDCKAANLFAAFNGIYEKEARENSQILLQDALLKLRIHLPRQTKDLTLKAKAIEKTIELHKFVFDDGNYAFLHVKMEHLYIDYADVLLQQERFDEVFSALENAYDHAKKFDAYLDKLHKEGEVGYTSTFTDSLKDYSKDVYATKALPELLTITLLDQNDIFYKKLHDDQRFIDLVKRIERDIGV
jgi:transcriptional regulator with XRE-family HTH domain